jgi:hypothetical protein
MSVATPPPADSKIRVWPCSSSAIPPSPGGFRLATGDTVLFRVPSSGELWRELAAMVQEAPLKIYARGVVSYFYFFRAPRARALKIRQINSAILKVPDGALSC